MTNNVYEDTKAKIRKIHRSRSDRMAGGVCAGFGKAVGVDPALVRVGLATATVLGFGTGAVVYAAAWMLLPEED